MPDPLSEHPARTWEVLALVLLAAIPVLLTTRPVLLRLAEPEDGAGKLPYPELPTRRFVVTCAVLAAGGAGLVGLTLPTATWPLWWVLAAPVLVLVAVDAETTWLPLPLTHACWAAGIGATALGAVLGGPGLLLQAVVGAGVAGLLYLVLWRLSGGQLGFGDVRLAPLLGAAAATAGWSTLLATLLLGSLAGAVVGLVRVVRRRQGAFAYAPSMLAGAFLACAVRALSG